mmetsp:Transcript_125529/g.313629  ORF Transcript_125529/g.313629 Transcript_125529/m.313629 type:complete len:494 (-) Transcript_125529:153-1634(-)
MPARASGNLACVGTLAQWAGYEEEAPQLGCESQLALAPPVAAVPRPPALAECVFERKGLRAWDVFWNESVAELKGRVLSVYDVDTSEGGEQRTLISHAMLCEEYEIKKTTARSFQVCLVANTSARCEFNFLWRFREADVMEQWHVLLCTACAPEAPTPVPVSSAEEKEEAVQASDANEGMSFLDLSLLGSALVCPALVGPAVVSELALWGLSSIISSSAVVADVDENLQGGVAADIKIPLEVETETTVSDRETAPDMTPTSPRGFLALLSRPRADAVAKAHQRPFKVSAGQFGKTFLWETELDITKYMEACRGFCQVLAVMGAWTTPMINEVHSTTGKIEQAVQAGMGPSLREVLRSEVVAGIHEEGALLADPSAAMGILWSYRGLLLWAETFKGCITEGRGEEEFPRGILKQSMDRAYEEVLQPYNGFVMRKAYAAGTALIPELNDIWHKLAPSKDKFYQDVGEWLGILSTMLPLIKAALSELDLMDTRKTW